MRIQIITASWTAASIKTIDSLSEKVQSVTSVTHSQSPVVKSDWAGSGILQGCWQTHCLDKKIIIFSVLA